MSVPTYNYQSSPCFPEFGSSAATEIETLRTTITELNARIDDRNAALLNKTIELAECQKDRDYYKANDRCAMSYLAEVRGIVGGDDFPDMVKRVAELQKQRDELLAALEHLEYEKSEVYRELSTLAKSIFRSYFFDRDEDYKSGRVVWECCDDSIGVVTQLSNMMAGLRNDNTALESENAKLRAEWGEPVAWEWKRTHLSGGYTREVTVSHQQALDWAADSSNLHQADTVTPLYARNAALLSKTVEFSECQKQRDELSAELSECQKDRDYYKANDRCAMSYLAEVRSIVGGDDFPDMVKQVAELQKQRDDLLAALEQIASGEDDNGSILSGGECQCIAYEAITNIKESK